jgi:hypothetical protein
MHTRGDLTFPDETWIRKTVKRHPCGHYDANNFLYNPIIINNREFESRCIMGIIADPLTKYFREDFLEIIMPELLEGSVQFGDIINSQTGEILTRWKTVWMPPIEIRAGINSRYWVCKTCGYKSYFPVGEEEDYILKCDIQEKKIAFTKIGIIFTNEIYQRMISHPQWKLMKKKMTIEKLNVITDPLDIYPHNLDDTPCELYRCGIPNTNISPC